MDQRQAVRVKAVIRICGVVQGVGFRPYIARLAKEYGIAGSVKNECGHVLIEAIGYENNLLGFMGSIPHRKPSGSHITTFEKQIVPLTQADATHNGFQIVASSGNGDGVVMPSPDIALCDDCLKELFTPGDPRYLNPFISCTNCGPRFSIISRIPYDRVNTTMEPFPLCPLCAAQYSEPFDRRYHAQTVCCNDCGPTLSFQSRESMADGSSVMTAAIHALKTHEIIAIKGIGGYHFACDPFDEGAVNKLRTLKGREHKPFAVMFRGLDNLKEYCEVNDHEETLLKSPARPIVLLKRKPSALSSKVYAGSPNLGAFLPYTPLQQLLLTETGPLVMTSANTTSLPIIKNDAEMLTFLETHAELHGVLLHNREILRRLDDSVTSVVINQTRMIRRARGYVPMPLSTKIENGLEILAAGSQEKNTICLHKGGFLYPSSEIGDLDSLESTKVYRETVADMQTTLNISPKLVVCDMHPNYESTRFAQSTWLPILKVQHHFAHIASVLAEHEICEPIIGVAFDGTGYGPDGTIWGGEFLIASPNNFIRAGHLKPVTLLGSDESIKQGWKSAACMLYDAGILEMASRDARYNLIHAALKNNINTIRSSSMGRVFDAVSSLLDICHESHYDGQCAIELENAAMRCFDSAQEEPFPFAFMEESSSIAVDLAPCIRAIYECRQNGEDIAKLAYRFHLAIAKVIFDMCMHLSEKYGINKVALSGGVFQNRILISMITPMLKKTGLTVYMNHQVPSGDGGISLGQAYIGLHTMNHKKEEMKQCALQFPVN